MRRMRFVTSLPRIPAFTQSFAKTGKGGSVVNIIADMYKGVAMLSHSGAARAGVENLTKFEI